MGLCHCDSRGFRNLVLLILRVTVGFIFIYNGWEKFTDMETAVGSFADMGFPAASFVAYVVASVELIGGIALVLGVWTKLFALVLAFVMLVALVVVHVEAMGCCFKSAQLPLVLFAASLALGRLGSGDWRLLKSECP